VHDFKNLIHGLSNKHEFIVTTKKSAILEKLLTHYGIKYIVLGAKGKSLAGKVLKQAYFTTLVCRLIKNLKIDMAMGVSVSIAQASKLCGIPSFYFDQDDLKESPLTAISGTPFASHVLTPDCLSFEKTKNAIYYPGYHELSYLHPRVFQPNPEVLAKYNLSEKDKYFILRFVALTAHHDTRLTGLDINQKRALINLLLKHGKVFITMETNMQPEFEQYRMPIAPHEMHDFLHYSQMLVCDGQTMCTEAGLLGVPSFRCNTVAGKVAVLEEEEKKYGLTYGYLPRQFDWMLDKIEEHLKMDNIKDEWKQRRQKLLNDKIDVTAFWSWMIDDYPNSVREASKPSFNYDRFR
jgi:predicted glycosyltransferase